MLRHFMTEAYIADAMPGFDDNRTDARWCPAGRRQRRQTPASPYAAPIRFIYETLMRAFPDDPTPIVEMEWEEGTLTAQRGRPTRSPRQSERQLRR